MVWLWLLCRPSAPPRLPLSVFGKSDVSRGKGRREKAEREREGKVLLNNKAWRPSREPRLASGVSLHSSLSLFPYLCLSLLSVFITLFLPHCLFRQPIPCWASHLQLAVYSFSLWIDAPPSLSPSQPLRPNLFPFSPGLAEVEVDDGGRLVHKTSKSRPLIYPGGVALRLRRFMAVSHVVAFKEPGFKNVGHLK